MKLIDVFATILFGIYVFYVFLLITSPKITKKEKSVYPDPFQYIVFIPCLNEMKVIDKTVRSVLNSAGNVHVVVIDDASDDDTLEIVRKINSKKIHIIERKLPNAQIGKGEALNEAFKKLVRVTRMLKVADSELIVTVLDGDGEFSKNALKEATIAFQDSSVSATQCRVKIRNNKRLLPLLQDVEFFTMVADIQNVRNYTNSVGLGGNGQFIRLSALKKLSMEAPWGNSLLEDYEMTLRLFLKAEKIKFLPRSIVAQEGLTSVKQLIMQRSRWVQGNIECLKYLRNILKSPKIGLAGKVDIFYFFSQPFLNLLGGILLFFSWIILSVFLYHLIHVEILYTGKLEHTLAFVLILILISIVPGMFFAIKYYWNVRAFKEVKSVSILRCVEAGLFMPLYNIIMIPSVVIAFKRYLSKENGWIKTERV
ncbi:glycosyltransferase family 2 protein [Listeria aquatica]|uniref:glycosyltransferase family 2 protein n=1 Tax=Listeria aquatica TaxID=1494960 RepID=UPI003F717F9C